MAKRKRALEVEEQAQVKVSRCISAIEVALADWEASKRPQRLKKKILFLKTTHRLLSLWMRRSLKGKKDVSSVVKRLKNFKEIHRMINSARVG